MWGMEVILQNRFRERLEEALRLAGISQSELGRRLGVRPQYVHDYLRGHNKEPGLAIAEKFALALGLPPSALVDESDLKRLLRKKPALSA